ncbi:substrate-binding domain-containing protein [Brachybacterium sp. GCM10030267]|uniref:substrate-binding domain-containing protein n=1 Tax=Brachybacterium sp. GCM10030267 TaxID=3273381 RepID=UPI003611B435
MTSELPASRRQQILDRVRLDGEALVKSLAEDLGVSTITVRRDIAALAEQNLLEQVRGGARRLEASAEAEPSDLTVPSHPAAKIAMVVPSMRYYWPTILRGAGDAAQRLGVDLSIHVSMANAEANRLVVDQIAADSATEALIIAPEMRAGAASEQLVERLAELSIPVVLAERGIESHGALDRVFDTVRSDHSSGAAMAVRHLASLGHRRIAFEGDPHSPTNPFVESGYTRCVELLGLSGIAAPSHVLDPHGAQPFEQIDAVLEHYREMGTTAALVHSDVAATLLVQHATRRGWSIPGDLSLVAYDDELSVTTRPALTAVAPSKYALGERAVELALQRLEAPGAPIEQVRLLPELRVRDSTAALEDALVGASGPDPASTTAAGPA